MNTYFHHWGLQWQSCVVGHKWQRHVPASFLGNGAVMTESGDGDHAPILDVMDIDRDFLEVSPHGGRLVLAHICLTPY